MAKGYTAAAASSLMIVVALYTSIAVGDATTAPAAVKFKSADANNAVGVEVTAEAKAKAEYDKALIAAKTKLIAELEIVKEKTTRAGDLDEALRLRDKIAELKEEIAALTDSRPTVVGDWTCESSKGWHGEMHLDADGTALADHSLKGRWSIEQGNLVIHWGDGQNINIYTAGTADRMTGKGTIDNSTLVATRVKK
jgi:hypothetical protein